MADFSSLKQTIQSFIKQNGNEEITGNILQDVLLAMVSTMGDGAINSLASALQNETTERQNQDATLQGNISTLGGRIDTLQTAINGINTKLAEGYIYAGIATPSTNPGTISGKVFYIAVQEGTYTNFGGTVVTEGITILKYNGTSWVKEQVIFTDGGVFDISAYHATGGTLAKYVDLAAALDGGNNIPQSVRKGGMSIKFVQSSDNKYVQYRYMGTEITGNPNPFLNTANWQKQGAEVIAYSTEQDTPFETKGLQVGDKVYNIKDASIVEKILSDNIINPSELVYGKYISNNIGNLSSNNNWVTTGYIDVSQLSGHTVYMSRQYKGFYECPFYYALAYDINKSPISASYTGNNENYSIVILSEYKYIRLCVKYFENAKWQLTDGQASAFEEYVAYNRIKNCDYVLPSQIQSIPYIIEMQTNMEGIEQFLEEHLIKNVGIELPSTRVSAKLINLSGQIINATSSNYEVTEPIPVTSGTKYYITGSAEYHKGVFAWYNGTTFVDGVFAPSDNSELVLTNYEWVCPTGVTQVRIACKNYVNTAKIAVNTFYSSPDKFFKWSGLKWAAMGDSLTEVNSRTTLHYFDYISKETGISVVNLGKSGTGYKKSYNTYLPFYQRVNTIPSDSDLITIFGSFNDLSAGDLGNITDNTSDTVCGCINLTLDGIYSLYPTKPLGIITPTPWGGVLTDGYLNYVNALISICENRGIPYLDLFHCSNLHGDENFKVLCYSKDGTYSNSQEGVTNAIQVTSENIDTVNAFLASGSTTVSIGDWVLPNLNAVHPNELGHKLIAPRFKAFLETLLM